METKTGIGIGIFLILAIIGLRMSGFIQMKETDETKTATTEITLELEEAEKVARILKEYKIIKIMGLDAPLPTKEKDNGKKELERILKILNNPLTLLDHEELSWLLLQIQLLPKEHSKPLVRALCEAVPQLHICKKEEKIEGLEVVVLYNKDTQLGDLHAQGIISSRAYNTLFSMRIYTIDDLDRYLKSSKNPKGKLMGIRNLGPNTAREVLEFMETQGYTY